MANTSGMGYIHRPSFIHQLSGAAKLLMILLGSVAAMITYDTRFLLAIIFLAIFAFALSKIKLREMRFVLMFVLVFMLLNNLFIFLFSPEEGVEIYGTRHEIAHLFGRYFITQEQLFYQLNISIKYFSITPLALLFFTTTEPSEFASSLNKIGVSYKISYAVSLSLRYIPNVLQEYKEIKQAQQARGIDTSKKASFRTRFKNTIAILFPLVLTSIDKIETVSNAMELRSFGKEKRRTWYRARKFSAADYVVVIGSALLVAGAVLMNILNNGRFYNPFI